MKTFTREIKEMALSLGFSACGIAPAHPLTEDQEFLQAWINKGFHGQMQYMERNIEKRGNPSMLLEDAASVISVIYRYDGSSRTFDQPYKIAKYGQVGDYHVIIKEKLLRLMDWINEFDETALSLACVDAAPAFDKRWGQQAGLGWIGKNTLLLNQQFGSFFNLGEIITTAKFDYDQPASDHCGQCHKCIDACPTGALAEGPILNAPKCIAYQTIEIKGDFDEITPLDFKGYIYGCDICQDVCPFNQPILSESVSLNLQDTPDDRSNLINWDQLTEETFRSTFQHSPLLRTGYKKILQNIQHNKNFRSENTAR